MQVCLTGMRCFKKYTVVKLLSFPYLQITTQTCYLKTFYEGLIVKCIRLRENEELNITSVYNEVVKNDPRHGG